MGREAIERLRFLASLPLAGAGREKTQPFMKAFNCFHSRLFILGLIYGQSKLTCLWWLDLQGCTTGSDLKVLMWLRAFSSCSRLTALPGPAWVLLSKTFKPFRPTQYMGGPRVLLTQFNMRPNSVKDHRRN